MTDLTLTTDVLILAAIVSISVYDIVPAAWTPDAEDTISERMRAHTRRWWVLPLAWGVLAGHWWGPPLPRVSWGPPALLVLGLVCVGLCAARVGERQGWRIADLILLVLGIPLGAVLWSLP